MAVTYTQNTAVSGPLAQVDISTTGGPGGSASVTAGSAGVGLQTWILFKTATGDPGTPSIIGACTVRVNITTANSNLTWSALPFRVNFNAGDDEITTTSGLAIGLGTTGVKTASVEATATYTLSGTTASAQLRLYIQGTSVASMVGVFVFTANQTITLPLDAGAAPEAAVFNLTTTKVGK